MDSQRWQRIEQIFHEALGLAATGRSDFLKQKCEGDEELRREVESLLAHHHEAGTFIESPAFGDPLDRQPISPQPSNEQPLSVGSVVGHYRIVGNIGSGGMGVVYEAEDLKLGRRVALKFLPEKLANDRDSLFRFHREARSASSLNHPNICTIHEIGEADGHAFMVMELVKGKTLRELLRSGQLPTRKAIEIAAQVAEGLTKAHEAGIAHRDLKPENLMVSDDGFVKILDFGLAKPTLPAAAAPHATDAPTWQTSAGMIFGTVGYMSPEQAGGRPIDYRSDQFSFGVVLYEIVTGKRAFQRETVAETLVAIMREQPEPVATHQREAPAPLCWLIERCLAKEPEKRYASTRELARELTAIRDRVSDRPALQIDTPATNLPVQRTGFVGRDKEIAEARDLLLRDDVHLVTITGPGGIGKSRLATQVAASLAEKFPGGIYFVPLSALKDSGLILPAIVQTLGIREAGGQSPMGILKQKFDESLRAPILLLLDNFEHLAEAAPMVSDLLAIGPNLKIMVTSRGALHVYGEHEFPVPPLALPDSRAYILPPPHVLSQYPAIALFVQRAMAAKPGFELNIDNAHAVAEICSRLDGLPLAIELAAARVKVLSPASMRTRLASRLQLLTGGARDLPQRQQTLRAAIDWSYDLLSPGEQKLFRRLSVFVGGCTLEGAEAVCDAKGDLDLDLLDGMASIVDKSLAYQIEAKGESRFMMLETIREYGQEKLEASGEDKLTKRAHAAYCLVIAEEETAEENVSGGSEWLDRLGLENDNFRAALERLVDTGEADWGLRLGAALFRFWEAREFLAEGRDRLGKLLRLPAAATRSKARARVLFAAGVLAGEQGDYGSAERLIYESLEISRELSDKQGIAVALNALAVYTRGRDIATARELLEESLREFRDLGEPRAIARSLSNLANIVSSQGDYDTARSLHEECLAIFLQIGDRAGVAWSFNYQGDIARDQEDVAVARALYEQALSIFRELGDRRGVGGTLADLGNLARQQKDFAAAHSLYCESIRIFQELDHKRGIARVLEGIACSAAAQLEADRSLRLAGAAAALRQNIGAPLTPAEQIKLEAGLDPARRALSNEAGTTAWLEGWSMPIEKAIEQVLMPEAASSSGSLRAL